MNPKPRIRPLPPDWTQPVERPDRLVGAELLNKTASFASNGLRQVGFWEEQAFGKGSLGFVAANYRFARFGWLRYSVFSLIK